MKKNNELSNELINKIEDLCEAGSDYAEDEQFTKAIKEWEKALTLVPAPQEQYKQSLWIHSSLGDAYFQEDNFEKGLQHFQEAKNNSAFNGSNNPFVLMRLGQCAMETGDINTAKAFLLKAFMIEGEDLFEEEDEKYLDFLKENVDLRKVK